VGDPPGVGGLLAGEDAHERGLAVAVAPDDADPVALADAERDAVQQRARAVDLADGLQVGQVPRRFGHGNRW
jgi:hypothetical protein